MYSFIASSKPSIIVYTSCAYYLYLYIDNTRALSIILMQRAAACAGNSVRVNTRRGVCCARVAPSVVCGFMQISRVLVVDHINPKRHLLCGSLCICARLFLCVCGKSLALASIGCYRNGACAIAIAN